MPERDGIRRRQAIRLGGVRSAGLVAACILAACAPAATPPAPAAPAAQPAASAAAPAASPATPSAAAPPTAAPAPAPASNTGPPEAVIIHTPGESLAGFAVTIAMDRGFFKEAGLDVSKQQMQTNTAIAALLSGEVDYSETIGSVSRAIVAQQTPLRIITVAANGIGFSLMGGPQVREVADLKGKPVGTYAPRDTSVIGLEVALKRFNLDLQRDDITVVPLSTDPGLFAGLASGAVGAVVIAPPYNFKAEKDLGAKHLFDLNDSLAAAWTGLSTSTRKLSDNPQQVRRLLRANLRAVDYIFANRPEVVAWVASHFDVDDDVAGRSVDQMMRLLGHDGEAPAAALDGLIDLAKQQAEVTTPVSPDQVYDFTLLREVRRDLGR